MKTKNVTEKNMKVCLVGSSGGHLTHLYLLVPEIFHEGQRKKNAVDSQDNAASTKPVNSRKGFYLDDIVGTFGVPVEEHRKESEVKQMDGYVSMGILTGKIAPEAGKD